MNWLTDLLWSETVAHTILIYSFVIALGIALGKIKIYGISLGITFVLFAGIMIGHFGFKVNSEMIDFIKEFGLILFVFSIGLQLGPGFFESFKKGGITLNLLALSIVFLGGLTTIVLHYVTRMPMSVMVGIMSGAVTNTPGLGAAQLALKQVSAGLPETNLPNIGLGYAVAYPFGVVGIIITMLLIKKLSKINIQQELKDYLQLNHPTEKFPEKVCVNVTNPNLFGKSISEISRLFDAEIIVSRILHEGVFYTAKADSCIYKNDILLIVTQTHHVNNVIMQFGSESELGIFSESHLLKSKQVLVTNHQVIGKDLGSLKLRTKYNINITRIYRSGIELVASPQLNLQMGDKLTVVGDEAAIDKVALIIGNSIKRMNEPNLVPIFIGILLGILLGSIPFTFPGIPNPLKLGLAGGPLIVAILISKYGHKFSMISYTTPSANLMLREIGIVLFLASVGIKSGEKFIPTLMSGDGFIWMGYGAVITLFPIIIVGFFARKVLKRNFFEICGLISGSMTDPPALAYANSIAQSEAPAVAYATVYPLVMFLRILLAQLLILFFV
ncbi:MAG: putative transporter [Bacteroidales bacterium]